MRLRIVERFLSWKCCVRGVPSKRINLPAYRWSMLNEPGTLLSSAATCRSLSQAIRSHLPVGSKAVGSFISCYYKASEACGEEQHVSPPRAKSPASDPSTCQ